jgi:SPP1 gp7 family putative phage head morphogenesis protein
MNRYDNTDKTIKYLNKKFLSIFSKAKSNLVAADELNVISASVEMYSELDGITRTALLQLAQKTYADTKGKRSKEIGNEWLLLILENYDAVTKYVYVNEIDRKRARFEESVIASENINEATKTALRLWSSMAAQYAVTVTDEAVLSAYRDMGIRRVKWLTVADERRCNICKGRHGKIYNIDEIPPKPHWNCRCYLVPV